MARTAQPNAGTGKNIMNPVIPNTTQIPHVIIREWMPRLKDIELRVLLVVADQTLGWIADVETGRRKEKDWISHHQLRTRIKKNGKRVAGERSVTHALASLVDDLRIIEALSEEGESLDSPQKRMQNGGKIFYRLKLRSPDVTLFDTPAKKTGVDKKASKHVEPPQKVRPQKVRATKETNLTKEIHASGGPDAEIPRKRDHTAFMQFWYVTVHRTRGFKPVISGADGANLKRVLNSGIDEGLLERIALYFLADYSFKKFSPTIATLCSSGILTGLLNGTKNDPEFNRKLNGYAEQYVPRILPSPAQSPPRAYGLTDIQAGLQQLASRFSANAGAGRA